MRSRGERGVALLIVLTIVALATLISAATLFDLAIEQRRTFNLLVGAQARGYALGAEDWVGELLRRDGENSEVDDFTEDWNQQGLVLPIDQQSSMTGTLIDLQGRFNVNNLVDDEGAADPAAVAQLRRLMEALGVANAAQLADAAVDWIDANGDVTFPYGAEDSVYLRRTPALRAPNRRITTVSELLALEGMTAEHWTLLAPHVAALPQRTAINVNTATEPVLRSLAADGASPDLSQVLVRQVQAPYKTTGEFAADFGAPVANGLALSVRSEWFRLSTTVAIGNHTSSLYSLLARTPGGATRTVRRSVDPQP
jgi:general secretion pathway protein K